MIYELAVPGPLEEVEEVRVLDWHGGIGQAFAPGELIVELETYKAVVEVRAGQHGTLRKILCAPGSWQRIAMPLAVFSDDADESLPDVPGALEALVVEFKIT
jgi:pyruvate/2-oxoglutarate dehydrogenase complex dihydrolipoamide acyltransferase (E2) component